MLLFEKPPVNPPPPVTGLMAVESAVLKALPDAPITCEVLAFLETRTLTIASPTMAVAMVTIEVRRLSILFAPLVS